jgi:hypothetical protein
MGTRMSEHLDFFNRDFKHAKQIAFCARHLEVMRADLGAAWWKLGAAAAHDDKQAVTLSPAWTSEHRTLAKHLIRHATESANHPTTVDFVTKDTLKHIYDMKGAKKRCTTGALKQWGLFTHEHMVPGAEVLRLLTDPDYPPNRAEQLAPLLGSLSWRALVTGTKRKKNKGDPTFEVGRLELEFADSLPDTTKVPGWTGPASLKDVPPEYLALMRYDASGLLSALMPVSRRAEGLVERYLEYKAQVSTKSAPAESALLAESADS